ncbi:hypothetical protein F0562_025843 [Nyssa sinensis]|uniref:CBS domain-containing protein n=1 Tax=Nyssa sinensis TaxID=561372 RepID=A0A5J5BD64_9ASTE|nr:hypothetical protein F0562_025843 [Nyssa sinensis]
MRQQRFVGILNSLDIVAFFARDGSLDDQDKAMKTPVSEVVIPNNSLLKVVDPATRRFWQRSPRNVELGSSSSEDAPRLLHQLNSDGPAGSSPW